MSKINSKDYWDYRFTSDWEKCQGREQSIFFTELAIQAFPEWFINEIHRQQLSICDWGCALGDGTNTLANFFPESNIAGVDFSSMAIQQASKKYGKIQFLCEDWLHNKRESKINEYDIVFSSNTLEHFSDPTVPLAALFRHAKLFVVLTLPFREVNRIDEHHYTFLSNNIKVNPSEDFLLVCATIINTAKLKPNYWPGEQIVLIFAQANWLQANPLTLDELHIDSEKTIIMREMLERKDQNIESMARTLAEHDVEISKLRVMLNDRDIQIASLTQVATERERQIASLTQVAAEREGHITSLTQVASEREGQIASLTQVAAERDGQITSLTQVVADRDGQIALLQKQVQGILTSTSWRFTKPLRALASCIRGVESGVTEANTDWHGLTYTAPEVTNGLSRWKRGILYLLQRYTRGVRRYGFLNSIPRSLLSLYTLSHAWLEKLIRHRQYEQRISKLTAMISSHCGLIDLFHVPMGWNTPLFQRFQHISQQSARFGALALYGGHHQVDKDLLVFERVQGNVVVFDALDERVVRCIFDAMRMTSQKKILRLQSIDLATRFEDVERFIADGITVVYEYIDEISEEITGTIPDFVKERHRAILQDERILVVATSDKLFDEVKRQRVGNCLLSTNGVDLMHWRKVPRKPPVDMKPVLKSGRTVVGYHGALAKWIDYELLRKIADHGDYELVLIGYEHDSSLAKNKLIQHPRIHFLGSKSYFVLNEYAAFYDVGILPFKRSALTESVSPVKIFEYMAANKPVITTDLPECAKYKSCLVAKSHQEFLEMLHMAVTLKNDKAYMTLLEMDATRNSWNEKVAEVFRLAGVQYD